MPRYIRLLLTGIASLLIASPAHSWGSKGHEIIAAVAETHLTDAARKRIKELLPKGTTLADASKWPDKAGRQIPDMDAYHFINFRKTPTHTISSGIASCATASSKLSAGTPRCSSQPMHRVTKRGLHFGSSLT